MAEENDKATEIGKGLVEKPKKAAETGINLAKNAKRLGKLAKFLKFFIQKFILAFLKWLAATLGPYVIVVIIIIILLLLVIDSVSAFDIFQLDNEREEYEATFDQTVLEVIKDRQEEAPTDIRDTIRATQLPPDYPAISEQWLFEAGEMMKLSYAIPTMHHYYKNLKNKTYKPWHKEFSEDQEPEFYELISEAYDYYYTDEEHMPKYEWGVVPIDEFIKTTTVTTCTHTDEDGNTSTTTSTSVDLKELPKRDIVETVELVYHKGTVPYKTEHTITNSTSSSGNCSSDIEVESKLYLVDESIPLQVELLPKQLIIFLSETAPEGKVSKLVKVQDLEFALELGREIDPSFPKIDMDYDGLIKCYKKKRSVSKCVDDHVFGGSAIANISGNWVPGDYMDLYKQAADACGIDWFVLASIHGVETGYSSNPVATDPTKGSKDANGNYVGAIGHFQFMPATWLGWNARDDFESTPKGNLIVGDVEILKDTSLIAKYGGVGKDGDGDGKADPWNIVDAAYSAACYLASNGYKKGDEDSIETAIRRYNHSDSYVQKVLENAEKIKKGGDSPISVAPGDITYPAVGYLTSPWGWRNIGAGNEFHYGIDIGGGGPIVSVADGVVTHVGPIGSWGNVVRVQHNINGQQFETLYAHLANNSFKVSVGQTVSKGQQVGVMGRTGRSTGIHLHFEVHVPKYVKQSVSAVNPQTIIPNIPRK